MYYLLCYGLGLITTPAIFGILIWIAGSDDEQPKAERGIYGSIKTPSPT